MLGLETSCDETAAAVVARGRDGRGRILSNVVRAQWEQHRQYGGVVPEIAARAHVECLDEIIAQVSAGEAEEAKYKPKNRRAVLDAVARGEISPSEAAGRLKEIGEA